jgi:hypothetical protein
MDIDVLEHVPPIFSEAMSQYVLPGLFLFVVIAIVWELRR